MTDVTTGGRCPTEALRATAARPLGFSPQMDANERKYFAEIGKGWRMRFLMRGYMGTCPDGIHWKSQPHGLAAGWL